MNYLQSLKLLNSLDNFERLKSPSKNRFLNLDRMKHVLKILGNPEKKFPSVLVGGTNGKGSTSFYLAESLRAAGYRAGLFVSPHLEEVRERIQINGKWISKTDFAKQSERLYSIISSHCEPSKKERRSNLRDCLAIWQASRNETYGKNEVLH